MYLILISHLCIQLGPIQHCEISYHHIGFTKDSSLLGRYSVKSDKRSPKFCRTVMSLVSSRPRRFLLTHVPVSNFNNLPNYWLQTCTVFLFCVRLLVDRRKKKLQPTCLWNISTEPLILFLSQVYKYSNIIQIQIIIHREMPDKLLR